MKNAIILLIKTPDNAPNIVPIPALIDLLKSFNLRYSPMKVPIIGPINIPKGGKMKNPSIVPIIAPIIPALLAPKYLAPIIVAI